MATKQIYKISVIIPVFNGANSLTRLLYEIDAQTIRQDIQCIFIDDGSTDSSLFFLNDYQKKHPNNCIVLSGKNRGAAHARNWGLECAQGEYIGFVDCDDRIDSTLFEKLYNAACSCRGDRVLEKADMAVCGYYRVNGDDYWVRDAKASTAFSKNIYQSPSLIRKNRPFIWNKIFSKAMITRESLRFDESLDIYEDLVFTYCSLCAANRVEQCPEALYSYTWNSNGSLTSVFSDKRLGLMRAFDLVCDFYKRKNALIECEEYLVYSFLEHLYVAIDANYPNKQARNAARDMVRSAFRWLDDNFPWWRSFKSYYRKHSLSPLLWKNPFYLDYRILKSAKFGSEAENKAKLRLRNSQKHSLYYRRKLNKPLHLSRMLFDPQHGKIPNGNTLRVLESIYGHHYLFNNDGVLDIGFACTNKNKEEISVLLSGIGIVDTKKVKITLLPYLSENYMEYLATSRIIATDATMPTSFIHRDGQIVYAFWHGTPMKFLGRDLNHDYQFATSNITKTFVLADKICFMSEYQARIMESAYMYKEYMQGRTWLSGYPRNDCLTKAKYSELLREKLSISQDSTLVAYMPTWRGLQRGIKSAVAILPILKEIDSKCPDNVHLLVNLHPYEAKAMEESYRHISKFPEDLATYDVLASCDVLVTDYSSVMFDWEVTEKKCILFPFDEEDYLAERGMYVLPSETGLPVVYNVSDLFREIRVLDATKMRDAFSLVKTNNSALEIVKSISNELNNSENNLVARRDIRDAIRAEKIFNKIVVFADDFRNARLNAVLKKLICHHNAKPEMRSRVLFGYDVDIVSNYELLKLMPTDIDYWGTMGSYMVSTKAERDFLMSVRCSPNKVSEQDIQKLNEMACLEWKRSYVNGASKTILCISDRVERLVFSTCSEFVKESVLYIPSCEFSEGFNNLSVYTQAPLLSRFDRVCVDKTIKISFQGWLDDMVPDIPAWRPKQVIYITPCNSIDDLIEL